MTRSPAGPRGPRGGFLSAIRERAVAKTSPGEFVRQVRLEGIQRVHWPTLKETWVTGLMVVIMTPLDRGASLRRSRE